MEGHSDASSPPVESGAVQPGPVGDRFGKPLTLALLALAVLAAIGLVYWRILHYPFIQDDWGQLGGLINANSLSYLSDALSVKGKLFYRPLSLAYFQLCYRLFGLNPLPFHVIGLTIHSINSLLVVLISRKLTGNPSISWFAGLMYAVAVTVHLDPLLWLVGFYDLSASFFYLASIAFFLTRHRWLSAAAFGLGLLAKESVVVLAPVLLLMLVYAIRPFRKVPGGVCRELWPHALILAAYLLVRTGGGLSPFSLPDGEPYSMRLFGIHVFKNAYRYAWWGLEAVTPFRNIGSGAARWVLWTLFLVGEILWLLSRNSRRALLFPSGWIMFLASWAGMGVLPALFLPNHYYKYYLTYSLLPLLLLTLSGLCWVLRFIPLLQGGGTSSPVVCSPDLVSCTSALRPLGSSNSAHPHLPRLLLGVFIALALADALSAAWYFQVRDQAGVSDQYTVGTNNLIHRGHAASLILSCLAREHRQVPKGSVFLLEGCDLESLDNGGALCVFYGDDSIRLFRASEMVMDPAGKYIERKAAYRRADNPQPYRIAVEPGKLFSLRIKDGKVLEADPLRPESHR